jgi:ABC-type antimicrobial peptide transport system permease subunit
LRHAVLGIASRIVLVTVFACAALLLAGIGLYGVVSYGVNGRIREFGIRLALGAHRDSIARLVLSQSARLAASGIALGLLISIPIAKLMSLLLFRVQPFDAVALSTGASALIAVTLVASYVPARRAASTDPAVLLHDD